MAADSAPSASSAQAVLLRVGQLAAAAAAAELRVAKQEQELKDAQAALRQIVTEDLPELLREASLKEITLEDGTKVKVVDEITCGISLERSAVCFAWLRDKGYGSIIRTDIKVSFGKEQVDAADDLYMRMVQEFGDAAEFKENVHPATLKSFIKERIAAGEPERVPPFEMFGVLPFALAKITLPKPSAAKKRL